MGPALPDKLFFRIGEVSSLLRLRPSVLRFWESEFPQLHPRKSGSGQRIYSRSDVELLAEIQKLVHQEKMTIEGARQKLARKTSSGPAVKEPSDVLLDAVREELLAIRRLVS